MHTSITFRATWTIKPGRLEASKKAAKEFVAAINKAQPGTRHVGAFLTSDAKHIIVEEVHQDPDAVRAHLTGKVVPNFMGKFMENMDGPAFETYGDLPDDSAAMIADFKPKSAKSVAGYIR